MELISKMVVGREKEMVSLQHRSLAVPRVYCLAIPQNAANIDFVSSAMYSVGYRCSTFFFANSTSVNNLMFGTRLAHTVLSYIFDEV